MLNIVRRLNHRAAGSLPIKPFRLYTYKPVVSFTFDGCSCSAIRTGGQILARHHVAGTYYICGGLTGMYEKDLPCHTKSDLKALQPDGHEIASRLFHPVRCDCLSAETLAREVAQNQAFVDDLLGDTRMVNFAYPFGSFGFRSKRFIARRFMTARGITPGLNQGVADFCHLRANALYTRTKTVEQVRSLIEKAAEVKAWLIFYTHDVAKAPSEWGTSPEMLEFAVACAIDAGCEVLTVRNAIGEHSGSMLRTRFLLGRNVSNSPTDPASVAS